MKVIQKTEHLLKLSNRLKIIGSLLFFSISSVIYLLLMLGMFLSIYLGVSSSGVEKLSCKKVERTIANCELSKSTFAGLMKSKSISIEGVKGSRVDKITDTDLEEVFLITNQGDVPLLSQTGDDVKLFNKYIERAVGELVIEKDYGSSLSDHLIGMLIVSPIVLFPLGATYFLFRYYFILENYIFDINASTLTIKKRGIWVNEVAERSLGEISKVELKTIYSENSNLYEVGLLMNEGDRLSLGKTANQKKQQKMADLIRSYLDGRSV